MTSKSPDLIVHCDWSKDADKRWMAKALRNDSKFVADMPELVGDLPTFLQRIRGETGETGAALIGFDFPVGITAKYAKIANIADFASVLPKLGKGRWVNFYNICRDKKEISPERPFYPYNFTPQGSKKRDHLVRGLQLTQFNDLLRHCELSQDDRRAAGSLFWTLGANAPGRGAISGWQDLIAPAIAEEKVKLWPFHGDLATLLQPRSIVIAETYPTQYHSLLFGHQVNGKRNLEVRMCEGVALKNWAAAKSVIISPDLNRAIDEGFPEGKDDAFDAVVGLFGMIDTIQNYSPAIEPRDPTICNIEGWILGQPVH